MSKLRRVFARAIVVTFAAMVALVALPVTSGADATFRLLGKFPAVGPLYVDSTAGVLYQVQGQVAPYTIQLRDLKTFKVRKEAKIDWTIPALAPTFRGAGAHRRGELAAVDSAHGRLFYPGRDATQNLQMTVVSASDGGLRTYRLSPPAIESAGGSAPAIQTGMEGLAYWASTNTLYALYLVPLSLSGTYHAAHGRLWVQALDADTGSIRWSRQVPSCNGLSTEQSMMPAFGRSADSIYLACTIGYSSGGSEAEATVVQKILLSSDGMPARNSSGEDDIRVFLAPGTGNRSMLDPATGRLFLLQAEALAVFDGVHEAWVGLIPTNNRPHIGLNSNIGRVYLCMQATGTEGGLLVTDAAAAVQPPTGAEYASVNCTSESSKWSIVGDPKYHNVFVPLQGGEWGAYRDTLPAYVKPPDFDPDEGAVDVPETPETTSATYSAQAAAYGTRIVAVGGPMGALDNSYPLLAEILRQNAYRVGLTVGESSREIRLASIPLSKFAGDGLEAYAIAGAQDDRVEGDLQSIRNYRLEGFNPNNQEFGDPERDAFYCTMATEEKAASCTIRNNAGQPNWPYEPAACFAFGGDSDRPEQHVSGANTRCDFRKLLLQADAAAQEFDIAGLVTIGDSSARTEIKRDVVRGVVAHAESVARNIVVAGQISIAEATASVDAWASGHKGKANTLYTRTFRGVRIGPANNPTFKCETVDECDPAKVLKAMNAVLGPRVQARLPKPDGELLMGTKKGTASSLRQNFWEQLEERVLYDKPSEDLTMAAFELRLTGNLRASSGLIVQLAGVTASTLYQISLKPTFELPPILPPIPTVVPTTIVTIPPTVDPGKPQVVTRTRTDRLRIGSKLLIGFGGNTGLVLAAWALLLSPAYLAIRRRFLLRWTVR